MGTPDYTDYVMGVRQWSVNTDGHLQSTTREDVWKPYEEQTARCEGNRRYGYYLMSGEEWEEPEGEPPHSKHMCGLYAFYDRDTCLAHGDPINANDVRGVVSAHGEIYEHEHGFRSQHMAVEAIIFEQKVATVMGSYVSLKRAHEKLAERYGVPLLEPHEVGAFMALMGTALEPEPAPLEEYTAGGLIPAPNAYTIWGGYAGISSAAARRNMGYLQPAASWYSADEVHVTWSPEPSTFKKFRQKVKRMFGDS